MSELEECARLIAELEELIARLRFLSRDRIVRCDEVYEYMLEMKGE